MILTVVAPRVLHHEVFRSLVVFSQTVNHHAVVVGGFPVVVALLAEFLSNGQLFVGSNFSTRVDGSAPACGVTAGQVAHFQVLGHVSVVLAVATAEIFFRYVGTPGERVAVLHGTVHHAHELVERQVVALGPTPVVLDFQDELGVEGMVRVGGERNVVVRVEAQVVLGISLRRIGLAVGGLHLLGQFAEVILVDVGQIVLPRDRNLVLLAFGQCRNVGRSHGIELVEVEE